MTTVPDLAVDGRTRWTADLTFLSLRSGAPSDGFPTFSIRVPLIQQRRISVAELLWLADVARSAGLDVEVCDGWETHGRTYCQMNPKGVVCHHTAGPATGDMPSLDLLIRGRSGLPGPLAHYGLGRGGKVYVVAAGTANHAGAGGWKGLDSNCDVVGIEAENTGKEPWPKRQLDAYVALVAAICEHLDIDTSMVAAHREWAPRRKPDPHSIDMDEFRHWVDQARSGVAAPAAAQVPTQPTIAFQVGRVIVSQRVNDFHPDVRRAQGLLSAYSPVSPGSLDGVAGPKFDTSVRAFQQLKGLPMTGDADEATWRALEGVD
jgi:hypothetical protein